MDLERAEALDLLRRLRTQIVFGQLLVSFSSLVGFRSSAGSNWLPHYRNGSGCSPASTPAAFAEKRDVARLRETAPVIPLRLLRRE